VLWAQGAYPGTVKRMGSGVIVYSSQPVEIGTLNHLAATYDGSMATIYINGMPAGARASNITIAPNDIGLYVGNSHGSTQDEGSEGAFNGTIDEVRIWNRALSASEASQQYQSALSKLAPDQGRFSLNKTGIPTGTHTYYLYANDGNSSDYSEERTLRVS